MKRYLVSCDYSTYNATSNDHKITKFVPYDNYFSDANFQIISFINRPQLRKRNLFYLNMINVIDVD